MAVSVYYDGDCGLCSATVAALTRIEPGCEIDWVRSQESGWLPPGVSRSDLSRSVYVHATHDGAVYEGFYAIRMLLRKFAPLRPLAAFLSLPGMDRLGVMAYRWVARNRYRLSKCRLRDAV